MRLGVTARRSVWGHAPKGGATYPLPQIGRYTFAADALCVTAGLTGIARPGRGEGAP